MAVSDYPNGTAPKSEMVYVENMWLSPDMARRIKFVAQYCRERGVSFSGTEGYRWLGVPSDRYVENASQTSTGGSNQWYQKGREDRGETPSAATPGYSNHGKGLSVDTNASNVAVRDQAFALVGMRRDIASETWHGTIVGNPVVNLDSYSVPASGGGYTPITSGDDEEMLSNEAQDWVTRTVRDQVTAIIRDQVLPAIEHSRSDAVGRQDQTIIPVIRDIQARVNKLPDASVIQREGGRARLFHNLDTGERVAIGTKFRKGFLRLNLGTDDARSQIASLREKEMVGDTYEQSLGLSQSRFDSMLADAGIKDDYYAEKDGK